MKRLCLVVSLMLLSACGSDDEHRLFIRLVNGTNVSQKVVVDGSIERKGLDGNYPHTITFKQTVSALAQSEQRVSVQDPVFAEEGSLVIYKDDRLILEALTPNGQSLGVWEEDVPDQDVECRILREDSELEEGEELLRCNTPEEPEEPAPVE